MMTISNTFIKRAADILGNTKTGLSGSQIAEHMSSYAYDINIEIPYPSHPFPKDIPNKRTALYHNLLSFSEEQQYKIIKELCELELFSNNKTVKDLKIKLTSRYGDSFSYSIPQEVDKVLVEATNAWLEGYPDAKKPFEDAIMMLENEIFERNLLDNLRLSFEILLKNLLGNNKSLENQLSELGNFLRFKNVSTELKNMIVKLIDYYTKYQNTYVKHNDTVNEKEIEFIFEYTTSLMKFLIRVA